LRHLQPYRALAYMGKPKRQVIGTLDRYIMRQLLQVFAGTCAIAVSLLVLEHMPRLLKLVEITGNKRAIVLRTLAGLLPEYGAIASLFGLYLGVALSVRQLCVRGEFDALAAAGIGPLRTLRMPLIFTCIVALSLFAIQGWLKPWGELQVTQVGHDMEAGRFGLKIPQGEFVSLGQNTLFSYDSIDRKSGAVTGIFIASSSETYNASTGTLRLSASGALVVELEYGVRFVENVDGTFASVQFRKLSYSGDTNEGTPSIETSATPEWQSMSFMQLAAADQAGAYATIGGRLLWVLFALLVPAIAWILGQPPLRTRHALGLVFGLFIVVLLVRLANFVEGSATAFPSLLTGAVGIICIGLVAGFIWLSSHRERGFLDARLIRGWTRLAKMLNTSQQIAKAK
jgi:lipopolysaccharide export system permease protein